jgi:hypothetical protein
MKLILTLVLLISSVSSFASWNEVECTGRIDNKKFEIEIERPFPNGSYFKRAQLTVSEDGANQTFNYTVTTRAHRGLSRVRFDAPKMELEVDFWPHPIPQWGYTYRGTFRSSDLGNQYIQGLNCRFL